MRIAIVAPQDPAGGTMVVKLNADGTVAQRGHLETLELQQSSAYGEGEVVRFVADTTILPQQT